MTNVETANVAAQSRRVAPTKPAAKNTPTRKNAAPRAKRAAKSAEPKKAARPTTAPRPESKADVILSLVGRAKGASLAAIMAATGWQAHSVRGFISLAQSRRGLKMNSVRNAKGTRVYKLAK